MDPTPAPPIAASTGSSMVGCPNCATRNIATNVLCTSCGNRLRGGTAESSTPAVAAIPGDDSANALRVFGWLGLIGGAIAGFLIYGEYGTVEVPTGFGYTATRTNPVAGWIAIAVFVQGLVSCVLFHGVAAAAENTAEIRRVLAGMSTR